MRIQDALKTKGSEVIAILEAATLAEAIQLMHVRQIGALAVLTPKGRLRGILSEREVVSAIAQDGWRALDWHVSAITPVAGPVVAPTDSISDAMKIMTEHRVRHLPVILESTVVGLISIGDAVKARLYEKIVENAVLQDIARWPRAPLAA